MGHRLSLGLCLALVLVGATACTSSEPVSPVGDPSSLIQEAKAALDEDDADAAVRALEQAVRLDANSVEAHFLLGNAYAKKEQFSQAEQRFQRALELDKNHPDARSNLGVVRYRQGKLQEAEEDFRMALALQPKDAEILYNLGGVLVALNRLDEALSQFLKAREVDPLLPEPHLGLGSVYKLQGEREQAITELKEYVRLSKDPTWREQANQMLRELGAGP